ncbi:MAG: type II toxin-antitoxin system PemK/MazF family toxin [Chloroflexota bacterium]|nr:type II toxin-antitoxin system PemK/MazF family toxin [Chloroflexota bacterium]MDE2896062.1 type II toxin-antitoxin system PemK/MazF family toxin [Chloroflexota bacterium]
MKRGELWTVAGGGDFLSKPRPALIIQSDAHQADHSVVIVPLTSDLNLGPALRPIVRPQHGNGLRFDSEIMVDQTTTVRPQRMGRYVGVLSEDDLGEVSQAIREFLDLD